jgi:hypothetical protein
MPWPALPALIALPPPPHRPLAFGCLLEASLAARLVCEQGLLACLASRASPAVGIASAQRLPILAVPSRPPSSSLFAKLWRPNWRCVKRGIGSPWPVMGYVGRRQKVGARRPSAWLKFACEAEGRGLIGAPPRPFHHAQNERRHLYERPPSAWLHIYSPPFSLCCCVGPFFFFVVVRVCLNTHAGCAQGTQAACLGSL